MQAKSDQKFFIGRQPILDASQQLYGYELLFRAAGDHVSAQFADQAQAAASVIASSLSDFGFQSLLGDKYGFINVTASVLHSEMLELLPMHQTVLEVLENIELDDNVRLRCAQLKSMGFRIALDDHIYAPEHSAFYKLVDIVKVDIMGTDPRELPKIASGLRKYGIKLLAERVETVEEFEKCLACGFELFQGYFFERPVIIGQNRVDPSGVTMMQLLKQLNENWDINGVEETFRENPGLTFNLLKLVNSVMIGLRQKIKNIRHAIMILGVDHLRRWVQLALFAGKDSRGLSSPLLEMAAVRGRLMEILMMQLTNRQRTSEQVETAFLTGILSLLDVLYETSMQSVVDSLNLSDEMAAALLYRRGFLGKLLELTERLEKMDFAAVHQLLEELSISFDQLQQAQLAAFSWRYSIVQNQRDAC